MRYLNRATCPRCRSNNTRRAEGAEQLLASQSQRAVWLCQADGCAARFVINQVSLIPATPKDAPPTGD